ncbi:MAG: hypothetical protein HYZ29_26740 [Myxococcales bacterium]|nr:hypothetical protein [Myxococcales bacterium]
MAKRHAGWAALLVFVSCGAAGCGDDDSGGGSSAGGTGSGAATGGAGAGGAGGAGAGGAGAGGAGGAAGSSGGSAGSGGASGGTGGASGGAGGTSTVILWTDSIQKTASSPWGFDGVGVEHPIGTAVSPNDANGANLSRVADPGGGSGHALRHFGTFDSGGSRSQAGIYGFANTVFGAQAKSAEGIYVAQEWYFPAVIGAGGDAWPWINLWDWHSTDTGGGNRWHTRPGLMLAEDGSMRVRWEWGGPSPNAASAESSVSLPVGKWFDVEMYYQWSTTGTTLKLWVDGVLALSQSGVTTRAPSHANVETYAKFYGSDQGKTPWAPTPSVRYTRNVRVAATRIWSG